MGDPEGRLPPPPPRPQGFVPKTLADVAGESSGKGTPEPASKKMKPTAIRKYEQMKRPGYGSAGTKVDLVTNHFKVTFRPRESVCQYSVTIDPPPRNASFNRRVMDALYATYGEEFLGGKRFAYDGEKSLFVVGSLDLNRNEYPVAIDARDGRRRAEGRSERPPGMDFNVSIAHAATVDMKSIEAVLHGKRDDKVQDALRVLDIMLREHAAKKSYLLLKDSFFHPSIGEAMPVGEGVVLWRGFHVSFRPTTGGLSLNFDIANTLIIKPTPVIEFLEEQCKKRINSFDEENWIKARRVLRGIMVETTTQRKHKIIGFSPESCERQMFSKRVRDGDGADAGEVQMSVAEYFAKERKYPLKFPHLRALDGGRAGKAVYLPLEICTITSGQRYRSALSTLQRQKQIDLTRQPPGERQSLILTAMKGNKYNDDELIKEFNVNIDQNMKSVAGRVLNAPKLLFGKGLEEVPRGGRWNFAGKSMKDPVAIPNWAVAGFLGRTKMDFKKIAEEMKATCGQKGMKLGDFKLEEEEPSQSRLPPHKRVEIMVEKLGKHLQKFMDPKKKLPDHEKPFVLAILPEKSPQLYIPFKQMCEVKIGIVTQCIVPPKGQVNPKYLTSVSLKINLKRGGYNSVLSSEEQKKLPKISQFPTIVFGLDVCHGSPGDGHSSVAAAVATADWPRISRFTTSVRAQPPKVEMIQGLYEGEKSGMVRELLMNFYNSCKSCKPQQILIFRDGVSESQFQEVLETELVAFKTACTKLDATYNPKITIVVVQKRHHTRFFPAKGGRDNVVPGTVVDKDPCDPTSNDFFMISHFGQIGTSRPTHYHVLYDEIGFTADEMQLVTNSLCYSYTRCTSAVSVVAPAYYAHLAAQHCRSFCEDNSDSGSDSSSIPMSTRIAKATATLPKLQDWVMKKMFYA